jgi:hypothetical protein
MNDHPGRLDNNDSFIESRGAAGLAGRLAPLLPGALVVALGFSSGAFLPGPVALAATGLALVLVVRVTLEDHRRATLTFGYVAGAAALALLACWTLASAIWSDAPARAVTEYDRVLVYLLGFVVLGSFGRTPARLRWAMRGVAAAAFAVCLCGLVTRLAPDVWPVAPTIADDRLSYPIGYWNALGLLAAIGIVLCLGLTSDDREPRLGRVLSAAALPVLAPTLLLTFSRGAIAVAVIGVLALIVAARPRALVGGLLVAAPAIAVSLMAAYGADLLATGNPTSAAATAQGHDVAQVVALCAVLAAVARAALLELDRRIASWRVPVRLRRPVVGWAAAVAVAAAAAAAALVVGAPAAIERQYDRFVDSGEIAGRPGDLRSRLTNPGNNGRLDHWRVGLEAFESERLRGVGAGTYALEWDRGRSRPSQVEDAHSLYVEMLAELGIVGLGLVGIAVLLVLGGFLARARGDERVVGGALFAAGLTWALHAGIDWDWEMPAVTFWLFAVGGLALSAPATRPPPAAGTAGARGGAGRIVAALGCIALAVVPARVFLSEGPLRESARAFAAGDCARAVDRALDSVAALGVRPEPFIVLGYCDVRLGQRELALRALRNAVVRDPRNWEGHYGLALVRAAAGRDPRPQLDVARRLNPRESLVEETRRLLGDDPRAWGRRALRARLPTD